jgi:uroporphyrinogen-III synthase
MTAPSTEGESSAPLRGVTIAVTRPREQADTLIERLESLGATVYHCAAIAIAPLEDFAELDAALERLETYDWVIFTSANGVNAVLSRLRALDRTFAPKGRAKIGAIGPATAGALPDAGLSADFVPTSYVAEAIIEQIGEVAGKMILLPRADIAREALAEGLRLKGATVEEVAAYRTVPGDGAAELAKLLRAGEVDVVTFTSSSTVRFSLQGLEASGLSREEALGMLNATAVICIGPVTASTARELGVEVAAVAEEYTEDGLVEAILALFIGGRGKYARD